MKPVMERWSWVLRSGEGSKSGGAAGLRTQTVLGDWMELSFKVMFVLAICCICCMAFHFD